MPNRRQSSPAAEFKSAGIGRNSRPGSNSGIVIIPSAPYDTAQIFLQQRRRRLICYRGRFYEYTGSKYREATAVRTELYAFLDSCVRYEEASAPKDNGDRSQRTSELVAVKPYDRMVDRVLDAVRARAAVLSELVPPCWLPGEEEPADARDLIACPKGLLNLMTGELLPATSEFFTLNAIDYAFDRAATCPNWFAYQDRVGLDEETKRQLKRMFGYLLTSDTGMQKIFMLQGAKRCGKGTVARVAKALVGEENAKTLESSKLSERFGLVPAIGRKLLIVPDARFNGRHGAETERMLSISGEDGIEVEFKGRNETATLRGLRLMVLTNEIPRYDDVSAVIASRFIILQFEGSFYGHEDPAVEAALYPELPGILNWAIEGLRELRTAGRFEQPARAQALIEVMEDLSSATRGFIREQCEVGPGLQFDWDTFYKRAMEWREANGHKRTSKVELKRALMSINPGIRVRRPRNGIDTTRPELVEGITLRHEAAPRPLPPSRRRDPIDSDEEYGAQLRANGYGDDEIRELGGIPPIAH